MAAKKLKPNAKSSPPARNTRQAAVKSKSRVTANDAGESAASRRIDERIRSLGDWRAETLMEIRRLIHEADPEIVEECKWVKPSYPMGVPVWSHAGIVCTGETYKEVVKLTFAKGASLSDPRKLFNSSLEGNLRRAIDIREGKSLDAEAFKALVRSAVAENLQSSPSKSKPAAIPVTKPKSVKLLSGGNPQIAKAYGDAPVKAYIAAMPGWKSEVGRRLDGLIERAVPNVYKAVKWNSPFYGIEGQGWFLGIHCFDRYVKVAFFRGQSLRPLPPGESKQKEVRYLDIHEDDRIDDAQFADWVQQASRLPGERM